MTPSTLERSIETYIKRHGIPEPERELRFHPERRWRFDFAWRDKHVALETEGGTFSGGRHTRAIGFHRDAEKYNAAALLGWLVLRLDTEMVKDELYVVGLLSEALSG